MKLSVIILTWNSEQHIKSCLASLLDELDSEIKSYEIFIVDNGSSDGSRGVIEDFANNHPEIIKPIFLEYNTGTTYSRNLALKQAKGKCIAILDSDIIVYQNTFLPLLQKLHESSHIGMVVPKLIYKNGDFQKSTDGFPTIFSKFRRYFFLKNMEQGEGEKIKSDAHLVDYAISAFWLLKREVVRNVGLLDEKIFYAPEDVDYCLRVWKSGYRILYCPDCEVIHDAQEISRGFKFNRAFWEHLKGLLYYFIKHRYFCRKPSFF